jgi:hypothetical protein
MYECKTKLHHHLEHKDLESLLEKDFLMQNKEPTVLDMYKEQQEPL